MDTPTPCDQTIYKEGTPVAMMVGANAKTIEEFVKNIAERSGQAVDWHYFAGRAIVKTIGDVERVKDAIESAKLQITFMEN